MFAYAAMIAAAVGVFFVVRDYGTALIAPPPNRKQQVPTIAVIEMASASGLALLEPDERDPWQTSTFGTGVYAARPSIGGKGQCSTPQIVRSNSAWATSTRPS